jgi:hypothetical protein
MKPEGGYLIVPLYMNFRNGGSKFLGYCKHAFMPKEAEAALVVFRHENPNDPAVVTGTQSEYLTAWRNVHNEHRSKCNNQG